MWYLLEVPTFEAKRFILLGIGVINYSVATPMDSDEIRLIQLGVRAYTPLVHFNFELADARAN